VLIALYENGTPFTMRLLGPEDPGAAAEGEALWPLKRMPLGLFHPGPVRLLPEDARAALPVRMMDRFFDNDISTPMQKFVADQLRPVEKRDTYGVSEAGCF
jgi:glutathione S-transferase